MASEIIRHKGNSLKNCLASKHSPAACALGLDHSLAEAIPTPGTVLTTFLFAFRAAATRSLSSQTYGNGSVVADTQ